MKYRIDNGIMFVVIDSHGAEICSIRNEDGKEYIWNADSDYWGRHAPVLFPVVGKFKENTYRYNHQEYHMGQHGFARDMEFTCKEQKEDEIWFELCDNEQTRQGYPFAFTLQIGYRLQGHSVEVTWMVRNEEPAKEMYFSIGAHPAFVCPWAEEKDETYQLAFRGADSLQYRFLNENGLLTEQLYELELENGQTAITEHFFDESAYVFENHQILEASLLSPGGRKFVTVKFDAPVVGIWSPEKKHAPFVCIEPWYGRCDKENFEGTLEEREWGNTLKPKQEFRRSYEMIFE